MCEAAGAGTHLDQFIRVESGTARVELGSARDAIDEIHEVEADWPRSSLPGCGTTWGTAPGSQALALSSLYAPPEHPWETVHATKADADAAEPDHPAGP